MTKISYIIQCIFLSDTDLNELEKIVLRLNSIEDKHIECIVLVSKVPDPVQSLPRRVRLVTYTDDMEHALETAVVTSIGSKLIFTTFDNLLADTHGIMNRQVTKYMGSSVAIAKEISRIAHLTGVHRSASVNYVIVDKHYAAKNIKLLLNMRQMVRVAGRSLNLQFMPETQATLPDILFATGLIIRPWRKVLNWHFGVSKKKIQAYLKSRKEMRLAQHVERAYYSEKIPVFIICRDRVKPLKRLVDWCEEEGLQNIIFIDNASSYPPLLKYLKLTEHKVIYLTENIGHTSPWDQGIIEAYAKDQAFIVTDPDIIPNKNAHGAVRLFCDLLNKYPVRRKVGFGLRIDNIPDKYELKEHVLAWEEVFWQTQVEPDVYDAEIDTTFAVYRPNTPYVIGPGLRTGGKYVAEHEPWYIDSKHIPADVNYYRKHANKVIGSWGTNTNDISAAYSKRLSKKVIR